MPQGETHSVVWHATRQTRCSITKLETRECAQQRSCQQQVYHLRGRPRGRDGERMKSRVGRLRRGRQLQKKVSTAHSKRPSHFLPYPRNFLPLFTPMHMFCICPASVTLSLWIAECRRGKRFSRARKSHWRAKREASFFTVGGSLPSSHPPCSFFLLPLLIPWPAVDACEVLLARYVR